MLCCINERPLFVLIYGLSLILISIPFLTPMYYFFNKMMLSYLLKETSHLAHLLSHQATAPMYIPLLTLAIMNPIIVHVFIPHPLPLPTRIAAVLHRCCCSPFAQSLQLCLHTHPPGESFLWIWRSSVTWYYCTYPSFSYLQS